MKFDIKNILIFALAIGMTSCVETMKDEDMSTGYLGVPALDANIQVEEFGATKAAPTLPALSVPDASTLHFKVTGSDNVVKWNENGLWSTALQMPVGAYTIEVNYGSNTFGAPYYTGTCTGTISAVTEAFPAIGLRLCNSLLAVVLADEFTQHFTPSEGNCVTITSTSGSTSTTLGNYVFVPSGEDLNIKVAGKSSTDVGKTLEWTLAPLSAATATYVTCSLTTTNAPKITMSSNADDYGAWGTVAYIPFASIENINEDNAANMEYLASSDGINFDIPGEIVEGVNVKFTGLTTGKKYSFCAKVGNVVSDIKELTVAPMPSIDVTATGTTSYDYYLAYKKGDPSKLTEANNAAPESVSGIGYSVSGIDDKLKKPEFGYSDTLKYDGSIVQQNTTKQNQPWGKHIVSATVTFAGQTFKGEKDCHITGLPYRCTDFSKESENWDASNSAITFSSDGIHFYTPSGKPTVTFKKNFTFPNNTNIVISAVFYKENKTATRSSTLALNFGSDQLSTTEYGSEKTLSGNYSVIGSIGMSGSFSYSYANRTADARIGNIIILYN